MDKVMDVIGISSCIMMLVLVVLFGIAKCFEAIDSKNGKCVYCNNSISESADIVCCSDGRRYHAECYLQYIKDGENGTE